MVECRGDARRMWRVSVTVSGAAMEPRLVEKALARLSEERPFLNELRYAADRAEISYWDEADSVVDVGSLALRMWNEHRISANLPRWDVVALEVTERTVHRDREQPDPVGTLSLLPRSR